MGAGGCIRAYGPTATKPAMGGLGTDASRRMTLRLIVERAYAIRPYVLRRSVSHTRHSMPQGCKGHDRRSHADAGQKHTSVLQVLLASGTYSTSGGVPRGDKSPMT